MDENKQLGIAVGAPVAMLLVGAIGGAATTTGVQTASLDSTVIEEQLDPETEKILYPYRVAKREKAALEADKILHPYKYPREDAPAKAEPEIASAPAIESTPDTAVIAKADPISVPPAPKMMEEPEEKPAPVEEPEGPSALDTFLALDDDTIGGLSPSTPPELTPTPDEATDPAPALPPASTTAIASTATEAADPAPAEPPTTSLALNSASPEVVQVAAESPIAASAEPEDPAPASPPVTSLPTVEPTQPVPTTVAATSAAPTSKPFLGVGIRDVSGTTVTTVYPNSTAEKLGVKLGDRVLQLNGKNVTSMDTLRSAISGISVGDETTITVERGKLAYELGPLTMGTK